VTGAAAISGRRGVVGVLAGALALLAGVVSGPQAWAEGEATSERRNFLSLGVGPAFDHESRTFSGGSPGASYTGWGPVLDVAVGRRVRPRLVIAGDLQLAMIVNRTESYLGGAYSIPLTDTLHLLDSLSAIADYTSWRRPSLHAGGGIGLVVATEIDTRMGSTATNLGFALSAHAGWERRLRRGWSVGVLARLTFYGFGCQTPTPASSSVGLLPVVLLTFSR
jgi:hypothetical protein